MERYRPSEALARHVRALFSPTASINDDEPDARGWTLFMGACALGLEDTFFGLLDDGSDVHFVSSDGCTPLLLAVAANHPSLSRRLLRLSPQSAMLHGWRQLLTAACEGLRALGGAEADEKLREEAGGSYGYDRDPPHPGPQMAEDWFWMVVEAVLSFFHRKRHGQLEASVRMSDLCDQPPHQAEVKQRAQQLHDMALHAPLSVFAKWALDYMTDVGGDMQCVTRCVELAVRLRDDDLRTHLMLAAGRAEPGAAGVMSALLMMAPDLMEMTDDAGWTALMHAAWGPSDEAVDIISLLTRHGANVNATNNMGETVLHMPQTLRHPDRLRELLRAGADPNARDMDLKTPLFRAAMLGLAPAINILVKAGARVNVRPRARRLPLQTPLYAAVADGHESAVAALLRHGADVHVANARGWGLMHAACRMRAPEGVVQMLLAAGAGVHAPTRSDGMTVLMAAARYARQAVVRMVAEAAMAAGGGAGGLEARDVNGLTALAHAAAGRSEVGVAHVRGGSGMQV